MCILFYFNARLTASAAIFESDSIEIVAAPSNGPSDEEGVVFVFTFWRA
jgi:hypothetical protein